MNKETSGVSRRGMLAASAGVAAMAMAGGRVQVAGAQEAASAGGSAVTKGRIKQSVCKWCFPKVSVEKLAAEGKRMGLKAIDLLSPDQFGALKDTGLICSMVNSHPIDPGLNRRENWD